ncbi:immunoglobulin superfamily member 5 isoform X4 [Alligator mississippiensis]|uniref:immunoglobulin superfamily member 5 isoform X4 n=1 Tax=Alligator mississippiensis TaxID=8496 RepID=UPI000906FFD5|nr:immunoglobulin superfamily member 5 isoform X4 [Alligator mississippiensis]
MDSLQKFILVSFTLFVSLTGLGFCYTIVRGPANATVLAGSEARFNCTVSQDWKIIIWLSNGKLVLTVVNPTGPVITDNRFTSQNYTAGNEFTSELIIHVVRQSDSGKIECGSQGGSENGYAFLTVQESTYQKEMRKVSAKKKDDGSLETRRRNGSENNGYIPEESWHPEQMPKVASLPPMASNFYGPEDLEVSSTSQISTQVPRQSSLLSRRSPLLYRNSIPLVQHFNHHRQQPKNQFLKSNQFRVSHPKPKVLYHRSLQPRGYHPYARVLFSHKQQPQSQHPLIRAPHPRTEQPRGQYPQTKTQPPRGQCSQPRFEQLRGQHIRSQQPQPRIQQVRSQHPQIRKQRPRGENSQVRIQKPKDSDL